MTAFDSESGGWYWSGDDTWQPFVLNKRYGIGLRTAWGCRSQRSSRPWSGGTLASCGRFGIRSM
jgi:hypothetical protein